jgi:predicted regulator of Ras-like GTPase activity (Roadblock/LC7/MglB family)
MVEDVQRALDNLRFDRMVKAFCILSPDNIVYQSTLDQETEVMVKQTVSLYQGQISQLTVNTEQGLVVISKIANNWLLAVLFPPNLSLGIAVVKTKATLLALRELDLNIIKTIPVPPAATTPAPTPSPTPPPPPAEPVSTTSTPEEPEPTSTPATPPPPPVTPAPAPISAPEVTPTPPPAPTDAIPEDELPPPLEPPPLEPPPVEAPESVAPPPPPATAKGRINLTFIPEGSANLLAALDKGSPVGGALFDKFGPYARDVLFLVDGKRDVKTIAFLLGLPEYAIVEVLEFAISNNILTKPVAA